MASYNITREMQEALALGLTLADFSDLCVWAAADLSEVSISSQSDLRSFRSRVAARRAPAPAAKPAIRGHCPICSYALRQTTGRYGQRWGHCPNCDWDERESARMNYHR